MFVFGSGSCARRIASSLGEYGVVVQSTSDSSNLELVYCSGFAGDFRLEFKQNGKKTTRQANAVVIAEDDRIEPNFAEYGLVPGSRVMTLSDLEEKIDQLCAEDIFEFSHKVAFLNGWEKESQPEVAGRMLALCHRIQTGGLANTFFFTNNLKVSPDGIERVCGQAKAAGAVFIKNAEYIPHVADAQNNTIAIDYVDELTRSSFCLSADWVIVDECHKPAKQLGGLAAGLRLFRDEAGFVQSDNVHRISNATNRRGIFVAGGSRGVMSRQEQMADADQVALRVLEYLDDSDREKLPAVQVNRGRCARCLTCLRLCPHMAIDYGYRVTIQPDACFGCGICAAGCPARAIDIQGVHIHSDLDRFFRRAEAASGKSAEQQRMVVFGCSRSAGRAHQLAVNMGAGLPPGVRFVEIPCGGTISSRHLLAAFDAGADGVLVCTCHTDNCKSEVGNRHARRQGAAAAKVLQMAGIEQERLMVASVAANMGREFCSLVDSFSGQISRFSVQKGSK